MNQARKDNVADKLKIKYLECYIRQVSATKLIMKKLLVYSATDSLQSFLSILCWILLPLFTRDSIWAQGFIITYPFQFIGLMLYNILFLSQIKYEEAIKSANHHHSVSGILLYTLIWIALFTTSYFGWKYVKIILGLADAMKNVFLLSCASLGLSFIVMSVVTMWQYEGKNKEAFLWTITWYISEISLFYIFNYMRLPLIYAMIIMCIVLIVMISQRFKNWRFQFKFSAIKYEVTDSARQAGMFIIYCFGLNKMSTKDTEFLAAYNIMTICSDTQWDIINSACDKYAVKSISEKTWSNRRMISHGLVFGSVLFSSMILFIFIIFMIPIYHNSINFKTVIILTLIEGTWFIFDGIANLMEHWISFAHPNPIQPACTSLEIALRAIFTYVLPGVYSISFSMACSEIMYILYTTIMYIYFRHKDIMRKK